jgi:hypothetical protein
MGDWFYSVLANQGKEVEKILQQNKKTLSSLLERMDVPATRKDISKQSNVRWLLRNLAVNNKDNPEFKTAQNMIIWLLRNNGKWS